MPDTNSDSVTSRRLEDAQKELSALKSEYERMVSSKFEEPQARSEDRMVGQMAGKQSDEGEFRFEEVERTSLLGELERLRAEKAAAESALSETLEKLDRKEAKIAQMRKEGSLDIDQLRRQLEDEKRKEIEGQKDVFNQLVESIEQELRTAEANVEALTNDKDRARRETLEIKQELEQFEAENAALRVKARDFDRSTLELEALRSKLDYESKRSSLLQDECSKLHTMVTDLSQSKSEQLDSMKRTYEETQAKEAAISKEREGTLKAEVERLKKQLEDISARLVHAETESKQDRGEAGSLRRKLQNAEDELQLNQEKLRSLQDLNSKLLEDLQTRHQADKDRLKRFYEDSLSKELESNKSFYEQKVAKLTSQLVLEREEKSRLQEQVSGHRLSEESRMDAERIKDAYLKSFSEEMEDLKQRYESNAAALRAERDKLVEQTADQSRKIAELQHDKGKLQKESDQSAAETHSEQQSRLKLAKELSDLKSQHEDALLNLEDARRILDNYKRSASDIQLLTDMENQIQELTHANDALKTELQKINEENSDFQQEVRLKEAEIQGLREESMQVHKELFEPKETQARSVLSHRSDSRDSEQSHKETMVIEGMISQHGENPILEKIKQMKREAPMSYSNVWKLFESLLQEKVRLDRLEMSMGRQPRTMTEFMLDFMYLHYGLKSLALKQLKALVLSLQELYRRNHVYGVIFCRFLGLFHPRPLPHHLAIYMLLVHEEFDRLSGKVKIKRSETFAEQYDILQYGNQASIIDAMELVIKICKKNRPAGERIIAQLLPEQEESRIDLILLKVCGTMARLGRDPADIFELLDKGREGSIEYRDFVDGIRFNLNIWVSQEEAEDLCLYINDRGTGDITYEEWTEKVNFKEYSDKVNSRAAMVSKAALLSALIEEYEFEVVQDYYTLRHMVKQQTLDSATAGEILWQIDPSLDDSNVEKLFDEAAEYESEFRGTVSPEAICIVVLRNRVGGFGVGIFGEG